MTRTFSIASLALSAGAACAQTVNLSIDIRHPILSVGSSTPVTLRAEFSTGDYAVAGIATDLVGEDSFGFPSGRWSDWQLVAPMDGPGTSAGETSGRFDVTGILAGQLNFPPAGIYADPVNPAPFFEATFTAPIDAGGGYRVDLLTETSRFDVYIDRESSTSESRMGVLVEGSAAIHVVPAPASAAVLALGLAATRRRR